MKKSLLLGSALAALAAPALAAPSGEITVWSWDVAAEALEATVEGFNKLYPDVKVNIVDTGNQPTYDRGLAGCAAGGVDLPDVYMVENGEAEVFWARFPDCFVDLNSMGAADVAAKFPDFKWTELSAGEARYAMPWDSGPVGMFYRRDLYEKAGVDPNAIETWDDFVAAGKKIADATGGKLRMATSAHATDDEWFRMIANAEGCGYFDAQGEAITVAQPGCVAAMETVKKLVDAGVLAAGGWNEQIQNIKAETVASAMFGGWYDGTIRANAPDQSGKWGLYLMPAVAKGGNRAANLGGSALAIPASSDNKEAAYAFVSYALATPEGQVAMLKHRGIVPSLLPALDDEYVKSGVDYYADQAIYADLLGTLPNIPASRGTQFFQEARTIMIGVQNDYLAGKYASAQAAMDEAAKQIANATGLPVAN